EGDVGHDAGADDDAFGVELEPVARDDSRDAALALEALELVAAVDHDAVLLEQLVKEAPGVGAEAAFERHALLHDDGAALTHLGERGGDLATDVRATDQDHVLGVREAVADRVGVRERAQVIDLLELASLDVEA